MPQRGLHIAGLSDASAPGAVASCVGIWCGALSGISRVPDQAARSMI
jgi:hypothetical protein